MAIVKMLERARFGTRSERLGAGRLSDDQYSLVLDEIETRVAGIEAEKDEASGHDDATVATPAQGLRAAS